MKQSQLKTGLVEITNTLDKDGNVVSTDVNKHKYLTKDKEQFFLGYVSMLSVFNELSGNSIKVYAYLLQRYSCGSHIGITSTVKDEIRDVIKSKARNNTVVDNALKELVEVKFLAKSGHGTYIINPRYAFKGSTDDRKKSLKAIIELECPDC